MVSLGTLSAGVAHEINNPLTFILGNAELLRDALTSDEPVPTRELIEDIVHGAQRIAAIVGDLRMFSRGDGETDAKAVSLPQAIDLALKLAGPTARARARVVVRTESTRAVHAVESRLVQVLVNLTINAAQAISADRPDPSITIRT